MPDITDKQMAIGGLSLIAALILVAQTVSGNTGDMTIVVGIVGAIAGLAGDNFFQKGE